VGDRSRLAVRYAYARSCLAHCRCYQRLLIEAIITAVFAILAFRKQSAEVATLQRQSDDQRKVNQGQAGVLELQARELQESLDERRREADERRSAQTRLVYVWEERATHHEMGKSPVDVVTAHVQNTSEQPVYDLRFSWRDDQVPVGPTTRTMPLMPGEADDDQRPSPDGAEPATFGAVVNFRDRAGRWWRARPDGQVESLPPGAEPPHSW
jgi:hypothetical protein